MIHSVTITSRSPSALLSRLSKFKAQNDFHLHTTIFSLSCPLGNSPTDLSNLVDHLTTFSETSIGCLSAPLKPGIASCSLAVIKPGYASSFRSDIPGRPKTQVGRWHAFRKRGENESENEFDGDVGVHDVMRSGEKVDWEELWRNKDSSRLPSDLTNLNPNKVDSILYFSDHSPEALSYALSASFPNANQLGLLASSTPFITGRPVTLFHNGSIYDTGAVGVVLKSSTRKEPCQFTLPEGIEPLGSPMNITDSEGNLINTLNHANPTQLLLSTIRAAGVDSTTAKMTFKEDTEFFLGALSDTNSLRQLHSITAGDPSRGTISLNTQTTAPPIGSRVQFYRRNSPPNSHMNPLINTLPARTLAFIVGSDSTTEEEVKKHDDDDDDSVFLEENFLAVSEHGFVLSRAGEAETAWTCTVPACLTSLRY